MILNTSIKWATDKEFRGKFAGQKGLVIGRGQGENYQRDGSLDKFNGIKIGCNSAYKTTSLNVLVWMDPHFFESHWMQIAQYPDVLKFAVEPIHYDHHYIDIIGLHAKQPARCSENFEAGFYPCNLSGYIALNRALLLGLNPIGLYGFNPDTQVIMERSENFGLIADWADKNNRQIYITNKDSFLNKFFDYSDLPLTQSGKRRALNVRSQEI